MFNILSETEFAFFISTSDISTLAIDKQIIAIKAAKDADTNAKLGLMFIAMPVVYVAAAHPKIPTF